MFSFDEHDRRSEQQCDAEEHKLPPVPHRYVVAPLVMQLINNDGTPKDLLTLTADEQFELGYVLDYLAAVADRLEKKVRKAKVKSCVN